MRNKNIFLNSKSNIKTDQHISGRSKNCYEVKRRLGDSATTTDGEYDLEVEVGEGERRVIKVYCHLMNTSSPREFLSLPATSNVMDNYSHIYSRRLIRPDVCSKKEYENQGPRTVR